MQTKQQKKIFSISSKYDEVLNILKTVPNQSEFICQAIIEKSNSTISDKSLTDDELRIRIKSILAEMITDDHIIIASKDKFVSTNDINPVQKNPEKQSVVKESSDEDIKSIINAW